MKLFSGALSMFGAKVEIALREKGLDFDIEMVPFDMELGYQPAFGRPGTRSLARLRRPSCRRPS